MKSIWNWDCGLLPTGIIQAQTTKRLISYKNLNQLSFFIDCISNSKDYSATAKEFNCSYSQVYSWVNKYGEKGIDGLKDGRGRNKSEDELSELEKLKAEIRILKSEKKRQQMEIDLLKKLEEIERR